VGKLDLMEPSEVGEFKGRRNANFMLKIHFAIRKSEASRKLAKAQGGLLASQKIGLVLRATVVV
jgi:hypothetical protein